jgi:hypothetical protein
VRVPGELQRGTAHAGLVLRSSALRSVLGPRRSFPASCQYLQWLARRPSHSLASRTALSDVYHGGAKRRREVHETELKESK